MDSPKPPMVSLEAGRSAGPDARSAAGVFVCPEVSPPRASRHVDATRDATGSTSQRLRIGSMATHAVIAGLAL